VGGEFAHPLVRPSRSRLGSRAQYDPLPPIRAFRSGTFLLGDSWAAVALRPLIPLPSGCSDLSGPRSLRGYDPATEVPVVGTSLDSEKARHGFGHDITQPEAVQRRP
jgi:hypothetical protein